MIRVCSALPTVEAADAFADNFRLHWPATVDLVTETFAPGLLERWQVAMPAARAGDMADGDVVAWLDPDIETLSAVPSYVIPQLLKAADLCFIGTSAAPADFGFWAVRVSASTRPFLAALQAGVAEDREPAAVWAAELSAAALEARDLTPDGAGAVWAHGPLGRYTRRGSGPA